MLVLAIVITLPIPFGNILPAIAMANPSFSIMPRLTIAIGGISAVVILVFMTSAILLVLPTFSVL